MVAEVCSLPRMFQKRSVVVHFVVHFIVVPAEAVVVVVVVDEV